MLIPPPPVLSPDFYGLALLVTAGGTFVTAIGTLVAVVVGAIRGGKKLAVIEDRTNGTAMAMVENNAAMTAEIKRLEVALAKSLEARLVAAENSRRDTEERRDANRAEDRDLQEKTDTGEPAAR